MKLLTLIKYTDPDDGNEKMFNFLAKIKGDCLYFATVLNINEDTLAFFDDSDRRRVGDCRNVLEEWIAQGGGDYEVTWAGLLEALNDAQLLEVARQLKKALTLYFSNGSRVVSK